MTTKGRVTQKDLAKELAIVINQKLQASLRESYKEALKTQLNSTPNLTAKDLYDEDFPLSSIELDKGFVDELISQIFTSIYDKLKVGVDVSVAGGRFTHRLVKAGVMKVKEQAYPYKARQMPIFLFTKTTKDRCSLPVEDES
jgi:nucleoid DNA-binding protein